MTRPTRIPELLRAALRAAMSVRRGPVLVEIPLDVLNDQKVDLSLIAPAAYRVPAPLPPNPDTVEAAAALSCAVPSPLLLVGGGVTRAAAHDLVVQLAERHGIPMITA